MIVAAVETTIHTASTVLGTFYPALKSYHAVYDMQGKEQNEEQIKLRRSWLQFWILTAPLLVLEHSPVGTSWIPGYHGFKLAVCCALLFPRMKGTEWLYRKVAPVLEAHETEIDAGLQRAYDVSMEKASHLRDVGIRHIRKRSVDLMLKGHDLLLSLHASPEVMPSIPEDHRIEEVSASEKEE